MKSTILSLCDYTGNWSRPYEEAGYEVIRIDLQHGQDVRLLRWIETPVHGILAAPPCTHFSKVGARYWAAKGEAALIEGLAVVDACLRAVAIYRPSWWALENPAGRLRDWIGPPKWSFQPHDYGDPWTKQTFLWGEFTPPVGMFASQSRHAVAPMYSAPGWLDCRNELPSKPIDPGLNQDIERSATPPGFATAFFQANP